MLPDAAAESRPDCIDPGPQHLSADVDAETSDGSNPSGIPATPRKR